MAVRSVVLAREEHAQLIRALLPQAQMAYNRHQLVAATVISNAVVFVSLEHLDLVDPTQVTVPIIVSLSGIDFVNAIAAIPSNTIAPPGAGRKIEPTMVAMKIASNRQDCGVTPSGTGIR